MTERNAEFFRKLNGKRKKWDIIAKRTAAKNPCEDVPEKKPRKPRKVTLVVYPGDTFDKLTVIEQRPSVNGNLMALFRCAGGSVDCSNEFVMRVSNARRNLTSGWCSCAPCYRAEGGAEIWKQKRPPVIEKKVPRVPVAEGPPPRDTALENRAVAVIAGRHKGVKVTTEGELQAMLKVPRTSLRRALVRAQTDGLICRKRTKHANGYVLVEGGMPVEVDAEDTSTKFLDDVRHLIGNARS